MTTNESSLYKIAVEQRDLYKMYLYKSRSALRAHDDKLQGEMYALAMQAQAEEQRIRAIIARDYPDTTDYSDSRLAN